MNVQLPNKFSASIYNVQLPNKLSALIYLAIDDLEKVEDDPRYEIDMDVWYSYINLDNTGGCFVCFAGAVMAGTLGASATTDPDRFYTSFGPEDFGVENEEKLIILDRFRHGTLKDISNSIALFYLKGVDVPMVWPQEFQPLNEAGLLSDDPFDSSPSPYDFPEYEESPEQFKAGARMVADVLAKHGF